MEYIVAVFKMLNKLKGILGFEGSYSEFNNYLRRFDEDILLDYKVSDELIELIESLDVEKQNLCLAIMANPGIPVDQLDENAIHSLKSLTDKQLLQFFGQIMWSVGIAENGDLALLKYNECIYNVGWHNYALQCRGKVINKNTLEVVSYPFDKFFNLGEHAQSNEHLVENMIAKAENISLTNKLDGSTIIVSNYNGNALITTNGSFNNEQTKWAREIFDEFYPEFINNVPEGHTFIFELIHPENRIILDYGTHRNVHLLAIRDNKTYQLFAYDRINPVANVYGFPCVEIEKFTNLSTLCKQAKEMKDANKEGWVVRIENNGVVDYMFKLKLEEYFILHRAKAHVSLKNMYNLYHCNLINDFVATTDDVTKQEVLDVIEDINITIGKIYKIVEERSIDVMDRIGVKVGEVNENREKLMALLAETKNDRLYGPYIIKYVKGFNIELSASRIRTSKFLEFYRDING